MSDTTMCPTIRTAPPYSRGEWAASGQRIVTPNTNPRVRWYPDGIPVALVAFDVDRAAECDANLRLIAAAPQMAIALCEALEALEGVIVRDALPIVALHVRDAIAAAGVSTCVRR